MNTTTGEIKNCLDIQKLSSDEQAKYVPVLRDLTEREETMRQINKYAPCGCGSGKKFKFCCYRPK